MIQSEDALIPWLTPRCLWTGCVSCPALLLSPRSCNLHPWGRLTRRSAFSRQIFAVGQQEEWNYWPGRRTRRRTFLCPSLSLQSNVRWLSQKTAADAQFPPYPTNNKLAKHEPESSSEGKRERERDDIPRSRRATFFIGDGDGVGGGREYCRTKNGSFLRHGLTSCGRGRKRGFLCYKDWW